MPLTAFFNDNIILGDGSYLDRKGIMVYLVFGCLRFCYYLSLHRIHLIIGLNGPKIVMRPTLTTLIWLWHLRVEGEIGIFELFETRLMYLLQ